MGITLGSRNGIAMQNKHMKRNRSKRQTSGSKFDLLKRQTIKRWKIRTVPARVSLGIFSRQSFRIGAAVFLLVCLVSAGIFISVTEAAKNLMDGIALPAEESVISNRLLLYSTPEMDARGSGDINMSELPILKSVQTKSYEVQKGDTLSEIAAANSIDVGTLISFNKIENVRRLRAGSSIMVPDLDGIPYTVKAGDSLEGIASKYKVTLESILDANDLQTAVIKQGQKLFIPGASISEYDYRKAMGTLFVYPVYGHLTSGYGYRNDPFTGVKRMHYGVDLANQTGTAVKASMEGTVAAIGNQPNGYGKYVVLKHGQGYQTLYGHMSTIMVRMNQYVYQGQKIGEVGNSGRSTGPHLHFSLYKNNIPINPLGGYLYK